MGIADRDGSVVTAKTGNVGKVNIRRKGIAGKYLNGLQQNITVCGIGIADIHIIRTGSKSGKVSGSLPVDTVDAVFIST